MSALVEQLNAALSGRYRIERELGRGGMATVHLAEDLKHHRAVAIKVLDPGLAAVIGAERFLREIEVAARLNHPHILPLHDSGSADDLLYYVMPYAEGESLRQRLEREKQLPLADALRVAGEVADALDYAHRRGVVHRDIKPENILLEEHHAVVADFGIARAIAAAGGEKLTTTGIVVGTPAYMSPEQGAGSRDLDGRSDLYSLGCLLYEMLAGQPPFMGPTAESVAHQHLNVLPRPVTELRPAVPKEVGRAITRALAKTAADRFRTAAEFATAIAASVEPGTVGWRPETGEQTVPIPGRAPRQAVRLSGRRGRPAVLALAAVVVALVAVAASQRWGPFAVWLGGSDTAHAGKQNWILVAEFDGPPEDSGLVSATRDLVIAALEQSQIVATVPADQINLALENAGKPPSTRVNAMVARELAHRSAVRTVLEGRVGRLGKGYSVVLRVVDADSAKVLVSVSDTARDEDALIPTVDRIARRLRAELGERRGAIQATRDWFVPAPTSSFEAFKLTRRAQDLHRATENRAAITVARSALAIDPDYCSPWGIMGFSFGNLGEPDSALDAFRRALSRPERIPERLKLSYSAQVARLTGDIDDALALSERLVQLEPQYGAAHSNRGWLLAAAGRHAEALESYRTAANVSPFGTNQIVLGNLFNKLLILGQVDEARALMPKLKGNNGVAAPMWAAAAAGQWSAAESLATVLRGNPAVATVPRRQACWHLAAVQASRGQVREAEQTLRKQQSEDETNGEHVSAIALRWGRIRLSLFARGFAADPGDPGRWDSTTAGLLAAGVWAAAAGDTTLARSLFATVRTRSAPDLVWQGFNPALLEAWIAARTGRWPDVLRVLGPAALQGTPRGFAQFQEPRAIRWLAAEAYERRDRPDSAAAYFERAIAPMPEGGTDWVYSRLAFSFGHRRLVLLYARMGRLEEARRHWEIFSRTFTRPDPEMQPLVAEARAALASAEGMAKSARR